MGQIDQSAPNPSRLFSAGPPGPPGAPGSNTALICLSGAGAPSNGIGNDGDLYVDTTGNLLYGPKTAGVWGNPISSSTSGAAGGDLQGNYPNPTLIATGTAGTYGTVTTDAQGRVTSGSASGPAPSGVELLANKDQPSGYPGLDAGTLLKTVEFPAFTGDVTTTSGGVVTVIGANVVSNNMLSIMADGRVKANLSGATGDPQDVTLADLAAALSIAAGGFKKVVFQTFTSSGTYTPTANMVYCIVELVASGGGGGGAAGVAAQSAGGGGGGAGGYAKKIFDATTIGASQVVTIGASGAGGAAGANNGANGAATSLGALLSGAGGGGGNGCPSSATTTSASAGAGGAGASGTLNITGGPGTVGLGLGATIVGFGGAGGSTPFALGGVASILASDGAAGSFGSGGAGAAAGATDHAGGNGGTGYMIITEFCNA